jgi:two-component system, NtrC family, response regulator HydG
MNATTVDERRARGSDSGQDRSRSWPGPAFPYIVGESERMQNIYAVITKVAEGNANVCIKGESGTGKELIAEALHAAGPRRHRPFVALDCAAARDFSTERQLFDHGRGGFTLFLNEIGDLAPHLQAGLLEVIGRSADVRVIATTNRDLRQAVHGGRFREELYYRITVVHVELAALRERKEDVPLLVAYFLRRKAAVHRKAIRGLTSRALEGLVANPWPGNVRQLEQWIERAVVLAEADLIDVEHFPSVIPETTTPLLPSMPQRLRLREVEKRYVLETLEQTGWNRARAARLLGISVRGLQYKLQRYLGEDKSIVSARPAIEPG